MPALSPTASPPLAGLLYKADAGSEGNCKALLVSWPVSEPMFVTDGEAWQAQGLIWWRRQAGTTMAEVGASQSACYEAGTTHEPPPRPKISVDSSPPIRGAPTPPSYQKIDSHIKRRLKEAGSLCAKTDRRFLAHPRPLITLSFISQ
jgi:hypothetical protein